MTTPKTPADRPVQDYLALLRAFAQLHGVPLETAQILQALAGDPQPRSPASAAQVLQTIGLHTDYHQGDWSDLAQIEAPVLALRTDGEWMVVSMARDQEALVQLPGQNHRVPMPRAEFQAQWAGAWLAAEPALTAAQERRPEERPKFGIGWFWESMGRHRVLFGEILLASLVIQLFALLTPLIFQGVIDKVLTHRTLSTLDVLIVALALVSLFEVGLTAIRHYLLSHTTHTVDAELASRLFRHLLRLPLSYFESKPGGDTVARVRELDNARNFLTGQALTSGLDLLFASVFLAVMFSYSVPLTLIVVAALPVLFAASWITAPLMRRKLEDKFAQNAENQAFLNETVGAMETLKSHAMEYRWAREWDRRLGNFARNSFQSGHVASASQQFVGLASKLLTVALLYFGAHLVISGDLSVGGLIAFNMLAGRVNGPILKLASLWQDYTQAKVSIKRLADIMDATPEPALQAWRTIPANLQGRVSFQHVSFRYAPDRPDVLTDLNLEVAAGEVIGIVGTSGAGKTSLIRLLQQLYPPNKGRVLIDGMDLGLLDTHWLRSQIGVVGQDALLFNRTVRENIALAQPDMAYEEVERAARLAGAHEFILDLPEGYNANIGERGSKLSGGQRARIALARALATNPRILLLDEATAALDSETERAIHDRMAEICAGRTVFIVAHRLTTLRRASRIIVLDRGRLVESGSHAQLMAQAGRYASLYRAQEQQEAPVQSAQPGTPPSPGQTPAAPAPTQGAAEPTDSFNVAAFALRQRRPAHVGRMVSLSVCAMALLCGLYAWFARMDVVVTAQGRVIPSGRSKTVQPMEPGVVQRIAVRDGQRVKAGDILLELDPTSSEADRERLQRELWEAQADAARIDAMTSGGVLTGPAGVPAATLANQQALLAGRLAEHRARLAAIDADQARRQADRDAIAAGLAQLRQSLPLVRKKHEMREELARTGHIAETGLIETRLELINLDKEIAVQGNRLKEAEAGIQSAQQQRSQAQAEFQARASAERVEAVRKQGSAHQDLVKAQQRRELQIIRAPIDGIVQQLAVSTVGGVVTQAQPLMTIVPENAPLEVEAQVQNRDVGHLRVGQRVINKVETFDFTRFGYIEGEVQWVGTDAMADPKLGPVYPVRIKLNASQTPKSVNGVAGNISPGMTVIADVRTDSRRLIEYFLAPMLRYQQEALRER